MILYDLFKEDHIKNYLCKVKEPQNKTKSAVAKGAQSHKKLRWMNLFHSKCGADSFILRHLIITRKNIINWLIKNVPVIFFKHIIHEWYGGTSAHIAEEQVSDHAYHIITPKRHDQWSLLSLLFLPLCKLHSKAWNIKS